MKLDRKVISGIMQLAGSHSTLSFMVLFEDSEAYKLFRSRRSELVMRLDVIQEYLRIKAKAKVPSTKREWLEAKRSIAKEDTRLRKEVRHELAQRYGEEATKLYDYSLLVSDYMWSVGMSLEDKIPTSVAEEIRILSKAYGTKEKAIETFLSNPSPKTDEPLSEAVIEYYNYFTFFLSYSHSDSNFVDVLTEILEGSSLVRVWRDEKSIDPGDSISEKLEKAISSSDYFGLILSSNSIASGWVQREYRAALQLQTESGLPKILPILIEDVEVPTFLKDIKYADFSKDFDLGMEGLIRAIRSRSG